MTALCGRRPFSASLQMRKLSMRVGKKVLQVRTTLGRGPAAVDTRGFLPWCLFAAIFPHPRHDLDRGSSHLCFHAQLPKVPSSHAPCAMTPHPLLEQLPCLTFSPFPQTSWVTLSQPPTGPVPVSCVLPGHIFISFHYTLMAAHCEVTHTCVHLPYPTVSS